MISDNTNGKLLPNDFQPAVDLVPVIVAIGMAATHLRFRYITRRLEEAALAAFKECEPPQVEWARMMPPFDFSALAAKIDPLCLDPCEPVNTSPASVVEFLEQKRQRVAQRQAEERRGRIKPWDSPGKRFR